MNKILCTGTAGFIFSNFIRRAIFDKEPYTFVSVDKINNNVLSSMYINKSNTFYLADIRDQHIMDRIFQFEKPDIVVNGAAEANVDYSLSDPNKFVSTNVLGTQVLLNCSVKYGVKKFVQISTDEIFGQLNNEDEIPWDEASPPNPRNPYAASKMSAELMVQAAYHSHGLSYNITRSSNNYGARQTPDKLIPRVIKCILNEEKIPIYGQGLQVRDWTHVNDNCRGILSVLKNGKDNEVYNISANQELTNIEVVQKICNIMGKGHDLIEHIIDPRGNAHDFRYAINSGKLRALGWAPEIKFKEGIIDTVKWYTDNPQWFEKDKI